MARPLRVEYGGALYHVMNRGNRRERVFRKAADHELFLARLARFSAEFTTVHHAELGLGVPREGLTYP